MIVGLFVQANYDDLTKNEVSEKCNYIILTIDISIQFYIYFKPIHDETFGKFAISNISAIVVKLYMCLGIHSCLIC